MRRFFCPNCGNELFFNSFDCVACGLAVGYQPSSFSFRPLELACQNRSPHSVCNWQVENGKGLCQACSLNQVIPDLSLPGNIRKWARLEDAKRRMLYSCLRFGLELDGLSFRFVARTAEEPAITGHQRGVITINISEADPAQREATREQMRERYRTLVGHFRHEVGHFYWSRVEHNPALLDEFRELFGDERQDYQSSLDQHYASQARDQSDDHISVYAGAHPWEDWAETFAHYLHLCDVLETSGEFGLAEHRLTYPPDFEAALLAWTGLSVALNEVNRSMGLQDLYPFVLSPTVNQKLAFVHRVVNHDPSLVQLQLDFNPS